jgi:CHAT domain-containing protein/tetratricopeptide (TPR) repeat protein
MHCGGHGLDRDFKPQWTISSVAGAMLLDSQLTCSAQPLKALRDSTRNRHRSLAHASIWAVALLLLIPLQCTVVVDPAMEYSRTRRLFQSGYLARSQELARQGYFRFLDTRPEWASLFLMLQAESMLWRGLNEETLQVLSTQPRTFYRTDEMVRKLTLEGVALIHLQRFAAATEKLAESRNLCGIQVYSTCGGMLQAQGIEALEQGDFGTAKDFLTRSLAFGRSHNDRILETTALSYLGVLALHIERYDEALDWSRSAYRIAIDDGQEDMAQTASGNLGWAFFKLGDRERALELFLEAEAHAAKLGDTVLQIQWLNTTGYVYMDEGRIQLARESYRRALQLARQINSKEDIATNLTVLAQASIASGNADEADAYANQALAMSQGGGHGSEWFDILAVQLQAATLRGDKNRAEALLREIEAGSESQTSTKWASERAVARLYEDSGETAAALNAYHSALHTFESARAEIQNEDSRLPFLANATRIYDDYIHFLVKRGKTDEALAAADQSRARTLAQGLGVNSSKPTLQSAAWRGTEIARKTGATVLFYWLGEKQSYLWAITPRKTTLFALPAQSEITPMIERYRKGILGPIAAGDTVRQEGVDLYHLLVEPAASLIGANSNVVVVSDGPLSLLNFETLIVPETGSGSGSHYWIEDANIVSAPSLYLLASRKAWRSTPGKLLLLGDAVSPNPDYPDLPMAAVEMRHIEKHFGAQDETVFARQSATSAAYLDTPLQQYSYIHFVAHGVASRTDPLDSAIILSRTGAAEDSFKLHAREIIQHPIDARLVTISACYGGGTRSYAGEGLVGLSWAFLRAGAHNVIGALWEASDDSTPQLMDSLYQGLEQGMNPSAALRQAKLTLMHSQARFSQPFYWAPFQIYTGM